jgi:CheY-like chemotaxis protein
MAVPLVLVVNDEETSCILMELFLKRAGYAVVTARHAKEAIQALHQYAPDVLVTDDVMPGKDGLDMVFELRNHPDFGRLPIVLTTVRGHTENLQKAREVGCDEIVILPLIGSDLTEAVARALVARQHVEPFIKGSALLLHDGLLNYDYVAQLCQFAASAITSPIIALPSRADEGGHNRNIGEATRASRTLTICVTTSVFKIDPIKAACQYFADHQMPMTAILLQDCQLPDAFDTCHVFAADDMEQYVDWLRRYHLPR